MRWLTLLLILSVNADCVQSVPPRATPAADTPVVWRWAGLELIGVQGPLRAAIASHVNIPLGEPFQKEVAERLSRSCVDLPAQLDLLAVRCTTLRKTGEGVFLVVDVVGRDEPERLASRPAPQGDVELPVAIIDAYARLEARYTERLMAGHPVGERANRGFLDFDDSALHQIVLELLALVPPQRELLLRALVEDRDAADRARAATLLHWAPDKESSIAQVYRYLDDPDPEVRNEISRLLLFHLGKVTSRATLRAVVGALARQLALPSHGDRNKALYGLAAVLDAAPDLAPWVEERAGRWLWRLGEESVLSNVRGVARELLVRLERLQKDAGTPPSPVPR